MDNDVQLQDKSPNVQEKPTQPKRSKFFLGGVAVAVVVVLALALGLGLGLGLKHTDSGSPAVSSSTAQASTSPVSSSSSTPASSSTTSIPTTPPVVQEWRRGTLDYSLDPSWDINAAPTTRAYNFNISEIQAAPDGVMRTILVINGQFPGPLIRANRGDRILVNVTNSLTNATTLHWHGIYQNGTNWMDGSTGITQCPIPPGRSFMYNFTIENQYGTYWYHSHFSTQYTDGLVGPLIVHAPEEAAVRKTYDYDQVVLLQDWYHDLSAALTPVYLASGNENNEPVPDAGLIQGTNIFDCTSLDSESDYTCQDNSTLAYFAVNQNKRYRLRLINTGAFAEYQFSIDNHTLSVIEADSTSVEPVEVHRLSIHIAQRYSVIVTTNQTAENYWIRAEMNTNCFAGDNPILNPDVRAILTYTNTTATPTDDDSVDWSDALDLFCEDLNSTLLVPTEIKQAPPADVIHVLVFNFNIGANAVDLAIVNGTTWSPSIVPTVNYVTSTLQNSPASINTTGYNGGSQLIVPVASSGPRVIDVLLNNFDDGSHPFHLHGHQFFIVAEGLVAESPAFPWNTYSTLNTTIANPMRRDTITIAAYGWVLIRFESDNPGMWALHCHISWHMEAGLLMQFRARDDLMAKWQIPESVLGLCAA